MSAAHFRRLRLHVHSAISRWVPQHIMEDVLPGSCGLLQNDRACTIPFGDVVVSTNGRSTRRKASAASWRGPSLTCLWLLRSVLRSARDTVANTSLIAVRYGPLDGYFSDLPSREHLARDDISHQDNPAISLLGQAPPNAAVRCALSSS